MYSKEGWEIVLFIISILLAVIGWLIVKLFSVQENANKHIQGVLEGLKKAIEELRISVEKLKLAIDSKEEGCIVTHQIVDKRLNSHSLRLDKLEKDLLIMESKMHKEK